jgi:hypothetical protein
VSFRSVGDVLPQTLEGLGIAARIQQERARAAWPAAAGTVAADLAAGSEAIALREATLVVRVRAPALGALVAARHDDLVAALNARLGPARIARVRLERAG